MEGLKVGYFDFLESVGQIEALGRESTYTHL
jgi:hypothetical protein